MMLRVGFTIQGWEGGEMRAGKGEHTYQENHPDGVVGKDDQANGDEAESHHLVRPRGLEKRDSSLVV